MHQCLDRGCQRRIWRKSNDNRIENACSGLRSFRTAVKRTKAVRGVKAKRKQVLKGYRIICFCEISFPASGSYKNSFPVLKQKPSSVSREIGWENHRNRPVLEILKKYNRQYAEHGWFFIDSHNVLNDCNIITLFSLVINLEPEVDHEDAHVPPLFAACFRFSPYLDTVDADHPSGQDQNMLPVSSAK